MARREHFIEHSSQLRVLSTLPLLRTPGLGTLRLGGVMAEHRNREAWERALNRDYYACGCDTGSKGLLLGLLVGAALAVPSFAAGIVGVVGAIGIGVGIALVGAVAGKLVGLVRAQDRLGRTIGEIESAVREQEPKLVETWTCG